MAFSHCKEALSPLLLLLLLLWWWPYGVAGVAIVDAIMGAL
jgi:hypothetical protein